MPGVLSGTGVWSPELRYGDATHVAELAAELESLGFSALWVPDVGGDLFPALDRLLDATSTVTIATGILNVWMHDATDTASWWTRLRDDALARVLLGLGASHAELIGDTWRRPLSVVRDYLDALDATGAVPPPSRCLAALGPKMLELARDRTAGAHPYIVTPDHTARARDVLGPDALLAPEQGVILDTDVARAREVARTNVQGYAQLPNYANNWRRSGFTDDDIEQVSDRLVDALVVCGDVDAIAARVGAHRDAGADHVCVQVIGERRGDPVPAATWRELAAALT
jgi:probable F420-dependent oxidoreductase